MKTNCYLISASYTIRDGKTVALLYGKSAKGNNIVVEDDIFLPYCVVEGLRPHLVTKLESYVPFTEKDYLNKYGHLDDYIGVLKVEPIALKLQNGETVPMHKVHVRTPKDVPRIRKWVPQYATVYSGDILYPLRYIYSKDLSAYVSIASSTVKVGHNSSIFTNPIYDKSEHFTPKLKILSFDIENSVRTHEIYVIGYTTHVLGTDLWSTGHITGKDERDLLTKFVELVRDQDPDIITGYNIDGYDWPLIVERCAYHGIAPAFGRNGSDIWIRNRTAIKGAPVHIEGRVSFDVFKMVRRTLQLVDESLGATCKSLGLEGKMSGIDASRMEEHWKRDKDVVIQYCMQDSILPIRISLHPKCQYYAKAFATSLTTKLPLEEAMNPVSSHMIDSVLIREYEREGYAIPMQHSDREFEDDDEEEEDEKYKGAYVHEMAPGLYDMVVVLDFSSMYPSQMMKNNIDYTTYVGAPGSTNDILVDDDKGRRVHSFLKEEVRPGIIPTVLKKFLAWRKEVKKLMAQAKADGNKDLEFYYDTLQYSIKADIMNAMYGVLGSSFYRFCILKEGHIKPIGESVTASAREDIIKCIDTIESQGYNVLYSDTDSIFIWSGASELKEAVAMGQRFAKELSKDPIYLEMEDVLDPWFNHGKKKFYAGKSAITGKVKIRGYALRRRDSFAKQREVLQKVIDALMNRENMDAVFTSVVKNLKGMVGDEYQTQSLILSQTCKDEKVYKFPDRMANVKTARKLVEYGYPFTPGQRVSWIVTDSSTPTLTVEPVVEGRPIPLPDYGYYFGRIGSTLEGIIAIYGWDWDTLLTGMKQSKLEV